MKNTLLFGLFALFMNLLIQQTYGQNVAPDQSGTMFHSGSWQLGVKEGYGRGDFLKNRNSLQLHAGYFLGRQLAVGLNATWSKEWTGDFGYKDLSAGPYVRYQFTNTWFSPFIEASYQIGKRSPDDNLGLGYSSVGMQSTQINPGISIELVKPLRLDLSYRLEWVYLSNNTQSFGLPQIGLTYLFR